MKYYIERTSGTVFAYESDGSQDEFIKEGLERLTDSEFAKIRQAQEAALIPTPEQVLLDVNAQRDRLLAFAGLRIAPLQDAVDLDEVTAAELASLKAWKQYRVAVNRVPEQQGYPGSVDWPRQPGEAQ
ncbi:tail fiber assembly protein [Pseudomonas sp. MWU349]|uniref:tail fiber assembly protein n=1 Tax=Pseudomonas sp. MWU349 TaxID=2802572 RepID=UPI001FF0C068|nr:tail fiber assembly protein [Pseudomonas sp. MWU349]